MRLLASLSLVALAASCAGRPEVPRSTPFSDALLARTEAAPVEEATHEGATAAPGTTPPPPPESVLVAGILDPDRVEKLRGIAGDDEALERHLASPPSREDIGVLAYLRSPAVRAARHRRETARTGYRQSAELEELLSLYRAFAREAAPGMPYLGLSTLSGEIVQRTVEMATEDLRAAVRDAAAAAEEIHADAARLVTARRILAEDLELARDLLKILGARLESGEESQAALLAFRSRVEKREAELEILAWQEAVLRARMNGLLDRPADAPANLGVERRGSSPEPSEVDSGALAARAREERPECRKAGLAVMRAATALRMAETMALPHARFPATGVRPGARPDFGVRAGQVEEMKARVAALEAKREAMKARAASEATEAAVRWNTAARRVTLFLEEVLPLAKQSVTAVRGAYEGGSAGYLDLLDASRRLLDARLGLADARRDLDRARAGLLRAVGSRVPAE